MATQGRPRKDGSRPWRAHWRDDVGRQRNKTFNTEKAARAWEAKMRQERDDRLLFLTYRAPNSAGWAALRSATLASVVAYAGLRPEEEIALKVGAYNEKARVLIIEDVFAADHRRRDTKTHVERVVQLQDALVEDLTLWIDVLAETDPNAWLSPPSPGQNVTRYTHRNWAGRAWARARDASVRGRSEFERTLGRATPRDLRAAYASPRASRLVGCRHRGKR